MTKRTNFRALLLFLAGLALSTLAILLALSGCSASIDDSAIDEYLAAAAAPSPPPATELEIRGLENWKALLSDLSEPNIRGRAARVYADRTFFNDTLKTLRTAKEIEAYLIETAGLIESGTVKYLDTVRGADGSHYVRWEMTYSGKKLAGGAPIRTVGMSHLRLDPEGRVILHQDFWDSSRGVFEHVPVIGPQVRWVKGRL